MATAWRVEEADDHGAALGTSTVGEGADEYTTCSQLGTGGRAHLGIHEPQLGPVGRAAVEIHLVRRALETSTFPRTHTTRPQNASGIPQSASGVTAEASATMSHAR